MGAVGAAAQRRGAASRPQPFARTPGARPGRPESARTRSSVGRATRLHRGGRRFESGRVHHGTPRARGGRLRASPRGRRGLRLGARCAVRLSPAPRGSRFGDVTSDRIVRGGLARIERRRISSRWARTARAGPRSPWRARRGAGCAPPCRPGPGPSQARPAPTRSRPCRPGAVAGPTSTPVPSRLAPLQAGPTRSSGNPRERTSTREHVT